MGWERFIVHLVLLVAYLSDYVVCKNRPFVIVTVKFDNSACKGKLYGLSRVGSVRSQELLTIFIQLMCSDCKVISPHYIILPLVQFKKIYPSFQQISGFLASVRLQKRPKLLKKAKLVTCFCFHWEVH